MRGAGIITVWAAGVAGVLVACRSAPPESLVQEPRLVRPAARPITGFPPVAAARPELTVEQLVPDFHDELRWPLSPMTHPVLEPRFDVAAVFAQPGVGWADLCQRGAQNRVVAGRLHDELEYLRGWCSAVAGDADAACRSLTPLLRSPVAGLPAAVRIDLANILASHGDADRAEHLLETHAIRDVEVADTLAAVYAELGRTSDAYELNRRALGSDVDPPPPTHCRRMVRDLVLGGDRAARLAELDAYASAIADPTCTTLLHAARCFAAPGLACEAHFHDAELTNHASAVSVAPQQAALLAAYVSWPVRPADTQTWLAIATQALDAMPSPEAAALVTVALDAAVKTSPACSQPTLGVVEAAAKLRFPRFIDELARCHRSP